MTHLRFFFCLGFFLTSCATVQAQIPLGTVAVTFPYIASKVLADPTRPQVYVADEVTGNVIVIDTKTLKVIASVPVGSQPTDMSISLDGSSLYVANSGSTLAAISVVDLPSLTFRSSFPLPGNPFAVAAGLGGRVYVVVDSNGPGLYQLDGTTGAIQTTIAGGVSYGSLLQISPDGQTLFASTGAGALYSFDVSTATPAALQSNVNAGSDGKQLVISHNGRYFCFPSGSGNSDTTYYTTFLYSTADITSYYGTFDNGPYPGPLAFSPEDSLIYQTIENPSPFTSYSLQVFDTRTFFLLHQVPIPALPANDDFNVTTSVVVDNTGTYLFIAETAFDGTGPNKVGLLSVVGTGAGTLSPPVPIINVEATVPSVVAGSGKHGTITVTRAGDLNRQVVVDYSISGSALNGTDYVKLSGKLRFTPHQAMGKIQIVPENTSSGSAAKTVELTLLPRATYKLGETTQAKVRIVEGSH